MLVELWISLLKACNFPLPLFLPKAKASGKKLQKVTLKVSPRGIVLNDSGTNELIENVSIYRCVVGHPALSPPLCLCPERGATLCWHLSSDLHSGLS